MCTVYVCVNIPDSKNFNTRCLNCVRETFASFINFDINNVIDLINSYISILGLIPLTECHFFGVLNKKILHKSCCV